MASSISSGVQTVGTLLFTGRNRVNALTVFTDGTNAATVSIYDATTATGSVRIKGVCTGAGLATHYMFENPVIFENGIYADVAGVGANFIVYFGG